MSLECSRGAEAQEPCSSKGDRPAHIQRPISGRLQEGAQEQEWTLTLPHSQAPQAEVLRDCPRPGASLTRAGRFLGTTREATGTAFFCGPVGSTEESMGLFINLTLTGQRAGAGKVCRMEHISHYLAPGGSGGRRGLEPLCTRCSYWPSQVHTGHSTRPPSTLQQSDVHFKLSLITNCVLPVMIVQVVQVVHFYFGVFD